MPNKEFLETYPLYRKFEVDLPEEADNIPMPRINLYCKNCGSMQTFLMTDKRDRFGVTLTRIPRSHDLTKMPIEVPIDNPSGGEILNVIYSCVGCGEFKQAYSIKISDNLDYVMKIGQYPQVSISINKNLKKILGKHEETYKKGLICEEQGYGIGAYAYYRRIVENVINDLLELIAELVDNENKKEYLEKVNKARKSHSAKDKIVIVKDYLPKSLEINGNNPLQTLYTALSKGIHSLDDEICLKIAGSIKSTLEMLVMETNRQIENKKVLAENMKVLNDIN